MTARKSTRVRELWRTRPKSRILRWSAALLGLLVVYAWFAGGIDLADLFSERRFANLRRFVGSELATPAVTDHGALAWALDLIGGRGLAAAWSTLWIAILAIVLAALGATAPALLGARTLMRARPYDDTAGGATRGLGWRLVTGATRFLCILARAIPEYVWAFLLLTMLGPVAWCLILALALHNMGILGRLGADTMENLDAGPLRSLYMLGARRRALALFGAVPAALPRFLLYFFYRFETCVREATVLGMLGGVVSLGYEIRESRARDAYEEVLLLIFLSVLLVLFADVLSHVARRWVRRAA